MKISPAQSARDYLCCFCLFLRLDEHKRAERLDEWICPEEFLGVCVHARVYLRTCAGSGSAMAHSVAGLSPRSCVQSSGQTTLVSRVIADTSGHGIILTLSS